MWKVSPPTDSAVDTYARCINTIRDADLRDRLDDAAPTVEAAATAFFSAASAGDVTGLDRVKLALPGISTKDMTWVYDKRLAAKRSAGRRVYDRLMLAVEHGRCPLCGQRNVSTLDHYLPKTVFPALAVNPYNLVPACSDCNWLKRNLMPTTASEATLHPYFDNVDDERWLNALVKQTAPASFRFMVMSPTSWNAVMSGRVETHFKIFRLGQLYSTHAAQELVNIRHSLQLINDVAGPEGVRIHLAREAKSRLLARHNSWQTATYLAMAADSWFCSKGFSIAS